MDALNARASAKNSRSPADADRSWKRPAIPFDFDPLFWLKVSRPGFWLTSIWFYLLPVAQHRVFGSAPFWIGLLFVTFPLGILIYGWNDIVDAENDRHNRRKGTFLFGARGTDAQLDALPWLIPAVHLPFLVLFCSREGWRMFAWYFALVAATALYNWPRAGLKNFPVADMLNQLGYLLVFYLSSALNHVPQLPWASFLFGGLFAMHSHLLGQIFDVVPDRLAHRRTTAVVIGPVPAKMLLSGFLVVETFIVLAAFHSLPIGLFLACGATWFWLDALWLYRARPYPEPLTRLFLISWNVIALASSWYVWSSGALSRLR